MEVLYSSDRILVVDIFNFNAICNIFNEKS